MISAALVLSLAAAQVRAPPDADVVTYLPRLDGVSAVLPFMEQAGERTALLRPRAWREVLHPLLQVDVTDPASIAAVGLDPSAPLTTWQRGNLDVTCTQVKDVKAFTNAAAERLKRYGAVGPVKLKGAPGQVVGARDALDRVQAAYALVGTTSCSALGHQGLSVEKSLGEVARLAARAPPATKALKLMKAVPGALYLVKPSGKDYGVVGLSGNGGTLSLDARARGLPLGGLAGPGPSPFAAATPQGMVTLRLRVAKERLPALIDELAGRIPGGRTLAPAAKALAPSMTGNLLLFISGVKPGAVWSRPEGRFFAMKLALLAETTDAEAAASAAKGLAPEALTFGTGRIEAGARGAIAYLATDPSARDAALEALAPTPGQQQHAGEVVVDPARLAKALASVPLLEAVKSPDLAGLVAVSTEVGPLLLDTKTITGWLDVDGDGLQRAHLKWTLKPKPAPDAGK